VVGNVLLSVHSTRPRLDNAGWPSHRSGHGMSWSTRPPQKGKASQRGPKRGIPERGKGPMRCCSLKSHFKTRSWQQNASSSTEARPQSGLSLYIFHATQESLHDKLARKGEDNGVEGDEGYVPLALPILNRSPRLRSWLKGQLV
jgi:hypothetical protein